MALDIELSLNPTEQEREAILNPLIAYNAAHCGDLPHEKFALSLRDSDSQAVVGGLYGRIAYGWMFVELLSVPEQGREQGTGSTLMAQAEALARDRQCLGIWLDTFSFQAPGFYKKLGFSEFGQIVDYPPGHRRHFLQKRLD
ncbi:MAG: Acetyltransferase [Pseudomonas sp.]|nr:MAG: Acetyltransferase [Pseudomonas sp.]